MTYELIDIVDEQDRILRQIERTPEWSKTRPDIHRFVHVYVFNSDNKLVVQQRSSRKEKGPLKFDAAVGGLVTAGLSYEAAAHKELSEELGLTNQILTLVSPFKDIDFQTNRLTAHAHLFELIHDGPYTGWEEEAERLETFDIQELHQMMKRFPYLFTDGFMNSLKVYCQVKKMPLP